MKLNPPARKLLLAAAISLTFVSLGTAAETTYTWDDLVSTISGVTYYTDPNLQNPWGVVPAEDGKTVWVADEGSGVVTRYLQDGQKFGIMTGGTKADPNYTAEVVAIPGTGTPTGIVLNHRAFLPITPGDTPEFPATTTQTVGTTANDDLVIDPDTGFLLVGMPVSGAGIPANAYVKSIIAGKGFVLSTKATATSATATATFTIPSRWLSVTEDGLVVGFNTGIVTACNVGSLTAYTGATAGTTGSAYTGCAISYTGTGAPSGATATLFAANYGTGLIDTYGANWTQGASFGLTTTSTPPLPALPATFTLPQSAAWRPYNVKQYATADKTITGATGKTVKIDRVLLVTYVLEEFTPGNPGIALTDEGYGFIAVYGTDGTFKTILAAPGVSTTSDSSLNEAWGLAIYHKDAHQKDDLLFVANQGNGSILSYPLSGVFSATATTPPATATDLLRPDLRALKLDSVKGLHFGVKPASVAAFAADDDEIDNGDGTLYFTADLLNLESQGLLGRIFQK